MAFPTHPPTPLFFLTEDEQREKSVSHHTVQQLIVEKEQALADLNSVEKSLADLFRRYEKMKEVLEGFRKVSPAEAPSFSSRACRCRLPAGTAVVLLAAEVVHPAASWGGENTRARWEQL